MTVSKRLLYGYLSMLEKRCSDQNLHVLAFSWISWLTEWAMSDPSANKIHIKYISSLTKLWGLWGQS